MLAPRLLSHLRRHPLTHDQALRLWVLTSFPKRRFSRLASDTRLLQLRLAYLREPERVQLSDLGRHVALGPDQRFRLPERHPFFCPCSACNGSGVSNEAELFTQDGTKVRRCPDCQGTGYQLVSAKAATH